jgi:uncharacterized protein YdiU (UPF0061 family)
VPQLGDGRAILLGEAVGPDGRRWALHLKGAGVTPYSRDGDGRAVLRSTVREYLCGEAMHGLGIPTTRSLCLVGSDLPVYRERAETAALLTRMAPSHVRFGSFEVLAHRRANDRLRTLADYVIAQHYPHLSDAPEADRYLRLLTEVIDRTARLLAQWQAVGFAHGVMNTDNMSILGITLDYGPFGFLDDYDPGFVCNHSDETGRYAFDRQPHIALWNLACLASAFLPLPGVDEDAARAALDRYAPAFNRRSLELVRAKLGLAEAMDGDDSLWTDLLDAMAAARADYTNTMRALGGFDASPGAENAALARRFGADRDADSRARWTAWADRYRRRLAAEGSVESDRRARMDRANPKFVLRNYLAQNAIDKAERHRDFSEIDRLLDLLRDPFAERLELSHYAADPPMWGKRLEVSCSS